VPVSKETPDGSTPKPSPACQTRFEKRASRLEIPLIAGQRPQTIEPGVAGPLEIPLRLRPHCPELLKGGAGRRKIPLDPREIAAEEKHPEKPRPAELPMEGKRLLSERSRSSVVAGIDGRCRHIFQRV